jgi:hypothetical protein
MLVLLGVSIIINVRLFVVVYRLYNENEELKRHLWNMTVKRGKYDKDF